MNQDRKVVRYYTDHLCRELDTDYAKPERFSEKQRLFRVHQIIDELIQMRSCSGLAEALRHIPIMYGCSQVASRIYSSILSLHPGFFEIDNNFSLAELAFVPFKYQMITEMKVDIKARVTAAQIFRRVLSKESLTNIYGGVDLHWVPELGSDRAVITFVAAAQTQRSIAHVDLTIHQCQHEVQDVDIIWIAKNISSINTFIFTGCLNITDTAFSEILTSFKYLETLVLDGCKNISGEGIGHKINPHIKHLSMSTCHRISDNFLLPMIRKCNKIEELHLSGCCLTDRFLQAAGPALSTLISLDLSNCDELTDTGIRAFSENIHIKLLSSLNLSGCGKLTDVGIIELAQICSLRYVSVAFQ